MLNTYSSNYYKINICYYTKVIFIEILNNIIDTN